MTLARENSSNDANSCFLHVERAGEVAQCPMRICPMPNANIPNANMP
ncbi:MAG: hypothetical protein F6J93_30855 [Oscillatoria sp. SIO1A7]|nr:hypothetical protein [Oscillatoria sp. SIO1A7]